MTNLEEFEAYAKSRLLTVNKMPSGAYVSDRTQFSLEVWQAARIGMVKVPARTVSATASPAPIVAVTKAMRKWCKRLAEGDVIYANSSRTSVYLRLGDISYKHSKGQGGFTWTMADKLEKAGLIEFTMDVSDKGTRPYKSKLTATGEKVAG